MDETSEPGDFRFDGVLCGTLPTRDQSSPRAELLAFLQLLRMTTGDVVVYSDYLPLVRALRRPPELISRTSPMVDMWALIWEAMDS
eukprot:2503318-Pyramimonas_sp.AAC.1